MPFLMVKYCDLRRWLIGIPKFAIKKKNAYFNMIKIEKNIWEEIFAVKKNHNVPPISARGMDSKERRRYGHE